MGPGRPLDFPIGGPLDAGAPRWLGRLLLGYALSPTEESLPGGHKPALQGF